MNDTEDIPQEEKPHVFVRGEGGSIFKLDLPLHESITDRLLKGYLTRVANAEGDPYVADEPLQEIAAASLAEDPGNVTPEIVAVAGLPTERPAITALKGEWVGWAVAESARRGDRITPDQAEAATKQDLIEKYGVSPADQTAQQ